MSKVNTHKSYTYVYIFATFLFIILSTQLVSSAPPFTPITVDNGLTVDTLIYSNLKANTDFTLHIHVFNTSTGLNLSNSTTICSFHLYNSTGNHILKEHKMSWDGSQEWETVIKGGNFSKVGSYSIEAWCVAGGLGGSERIYFDVSNNGFDVSSGKAFLYVGLLFLLVVFLIGTVTLFVMFDNLLNRVGMFGLSYLLTLAISFIAWQMSNDFLFSSPFLIEMFRIIFFVLTIGAFPLLIGVFAWYVIMLFKIKEIENLMTKGMSYDEAERRQGGKYK